MKKIYIGPSNFANLSGNLEKALCSVGFRADFIAWSHSADPFNYGQKKVFKVINNPSFKVFNINILYFINEYFIKPYYFLLALIKYDVFIFTKPSTFLLKNIDLKILAFFNKQVCTFYVGCSDRDMSYDSDPEYVCNTCYDIVKQNTCKCDNRDEKYFQANYFFKYSDHIFGLPDTTNYLQIKSKVHLFKYPAPAIKIKAVNKNFSGRLRISHLPSNPSLKGTHIIEPILNKLAIEEKDIEIVIKKDIWPRQKILQELENCHILIDSIAGYVFGTLSLEAIQHGCIALNAYPEWIAKNYEISPVVKITGDTLYRTLKELINNRDIMRFYAEQSQKAYNKYFSYTSAGQYYKDILKQ